MGRNVTEAATQKMGHNVSIHMPPVDPRYSWYGLESHPDKPECIELEDGDTEDLVTYLGRCSDHWEQHPPAAPPGFWLVSCDNEPRHWPWYVPIDVDFYEPGCPTCVASSERAAHAGCEHSHHWPWRRWKITGTAFMWLYRMRLIKGHGIQYGEHCKGCQTVHWGIRKGWRAERQWAKWNRQQNGEES
jgi:hypothetical protein